MHLRVIEIMKTSIGSAMFYPTGTNPYHLDTNNPYRIGSMRKAALIQLREFGIIPDGFSVWSDREKRDIGRDDIRW